MKALILAVAAIVALVVSSKGFAEEKSNAEVVQQYLRAKIIPSADEIKKMQKDSCLGAKLFWYGPEGGRCHFCQVGKRLENGKCVCPEGFEDLGARRSCACPKDMHVYFDKKGMQCVAKEAGQYVLVKETVQEQPEVKTVDDKKKACLVDPACRPKPGQQYELPKIDTAF